LFGLLKKIPIRKIGDIIKQMKFTLIVQIILSLILIVLVTLQSKETSLGSGFSSVTQSGIHTKRGPEKLIYLATIVIGVIFVILSFLNIAIWK